MTGRGQSARGAGRSQMTDYSLDSRRGRGRPRKPPHAPVLQLPTEMEHEMEEELREGEEGSFFEGEDEERLDLEKIKQIQHQKMMIVTPMAQKRNRGRPRNNASNQQQVDEELVEEESAVTEAPIQHDNIEESGPLEGPGPSEPKSQPPIISRSSRTRHAPKRLGDFLLHSTERQTKPRTPVQPKAVVAESEAPNLSPPPAADAPTINEQEQTEQLIPNDEQVEETEANVQAQKDKTPAETTPVPDAILSQLEKPGEEDSSGPPPPPRHLVNKQNGRGRPANIIPPHRRPLPKDLMPPGTLKRVSLMREPPTPKRARETTPGADPRGHLHDVRSGEASPIVSSMPSSSSTNAHTNQSQQHPKGSVPMPNPIPMTAPVDIKAEPPEAVKEVVIGDNEGPPPMPAVLQQHLQPQHAPGSFTASNVPSSSGHASQEGVGKKREREAGKDLPSEHFPKEKARHVSTRGLIPFDSNKSSMHPYEQVIMHDDMVQGDVGGGPQQRVLTLQGGSFIEDRIGRADMMEDEEMKMMKSMQQQRYIQVEEDGVNVMYAVDPNDVIEGEEQVEMEDPNVRDVGQQEQYVMGRHAKVEIEDDDDDMPPQLVAEGIPEEEVGVQNAMQNGEEKDLPLDADGNFDLNMLEEGETIRLSSPGGHSHMVRLTRDEEGNALFVDEHGNFVELVTDTGAMVETNNMDQEPQEMMEDAQEHDKKKQMMPPQVLIANGEGSSGQIGTIQGERANLEFSFLDSNNICCGLCGEIVLYEKLVSDHLPTAHPEFLSPGVELEEVPYDSWLKTRLKQEMKSMQNGFRHYDDHDGGGFGGSVRLYSKGMRQLRKVSQIRVNVNEMTMSQLEIALKRKLIEKMGRKVPVSLVDRLHARCDICQAVVSLNKKFEVVHLVRHFNAWHPAEHRCSQEWKDAPPVTNPASRRPLSLHDFAVVSTDSDQNNLQCIWCGMFMDRAALGMHFSEVHAQQVVVPNCSLCLQEMVMTARLMEKYGEDFGISLPDEFHLQSSKLDAKFSSEKTLDKAIDKHLKRSKNGNDNDDDDGQDETEAICTTNSQQSFGRRNRLKRKFVKPCFRQICPTNSQFFEAKSACEWRCKLCHRNVYGAVISAGAIKHYKEFHPSEIDNMQYELVKARLERIGDGSMEFVHPQLVECLICNLTYALHKPFNICRAIRHLRLKHPEVMPETAGKPISGAEIAETTDLNKPKIKREIRLAEVISDPIELERFRKDNFDQHFDKVQVVYGIKKNNEPAYILLMEHENMDLKIAQEMADKVEQGDGDMHDGRFGILIGGEEDEMQVEHEYDTPSEQTGAALFGQESKPQRMLLDFPEQIVEEETEEMAGTEYIPQYDSSNPDHVLLEEGDMMPGENYEMIQEGEYQEMDEDNRTVRYLTEEEIQEAQARGEFLEFADEYVEEYTQQ